MNTDQKLAATDAKMAEWQWCLKHRVCLTDDCEGTLPPRDNSNFARSLELYCAACSTPEKVSEREERDRLRRAEAHRANEERQRVEREERRVKRMSRVLDSMPPRYRGIDLDASPLMSRVVRSKAIGEARDAIGKEDGPGTITIVGGAGSGKTTLAAAIIGTVVQRAIADTTGKDYFTWAAENAFWVSAPELARARPGQKLGEGEAPLVERAMGASLLVLDDVGMERQDIGGAIFDTIYSRHDAELVTVITTGLSSAELGLKYGDGVTRRMIEKSCATIIHCAARPAKKAEAA